jgi:RimJ/RimL family protein N-acetyltransferase
VIMARTFDIPRLETSHLVLRAPIRADFDAYAEVLASPRAACMGGPYDRAAAWTDWCVAVAEWVLHRLGPWTVTAKGTDTALGWAGLSRHPACPEPEMAWVMTAGAEGRGIALEAGRAVLSHAFEALRLPALVSYIRPGNTRAEALATRLGGVPDPSAEALPGTTVYRYSQGMIRS